MTRSDPARAWWRPLDAGDPHEQFRQNYADPRTGDIHLYHMTNRWLGGLCAWGSMGLAFLAVGPYAQSGPDPSSGAEVAVFLVFAFILSVGAALVLASTEVNLRGSEVEILNPLRRYRFQLGAVQDVGLSAWSSFPRVRLEGRQVRIVALQQPRLAMDGDPITWSGELAFLQEEASRARAVGVARRNDVRVAWRRPGRPVCLLLLSWLAFLASYLFLPLA